MEKVESIATGPKKVSLKMKRIVGLIKDIFVGKFRLPKFKFDESLFFELVEEKAAKLGVTDVKKTKVNFKEGPIDMIAGTFNFKTKEITVDYLEIFLVSLFSFPRDQAELIDTYDKKVTSTLGHEAGHWILDMKKGSSAVREIKRMTLKYFLLFLIPFFFIAWGEVSLFWGFTSALYGMSLFVGLSLGSIVAIFGLALLLLITAVNFLLAILLAKSVTYQKCEHEKFARAYAEEIMNDERWKDVIVCQS